MCVWLRPPAASLGGFWLFGTVFGFKTWARNFQNFRIAEFQLSFQTLGTPEFHRSCNCLTFSLRFFLSSSFYLCPRSARDIKDVDGEERPLLDPQDAGSVRLQRHQFRRIPHECRKQIVRSAQHQALPSVQQWRHHARPAR